MWRPEYVAFMPAAGQYCTVAGATKTCQDVLNHNTSYGIVQLVYCIAIQQLCIFILSFSHFSIRTGFDHKYFIQQWRGDLAGRITGL